MLNVTWSPGAACDAASVHFGPPIKRTDILVNNDMHSGNYLSLFKSSNTPVLGNLLVYLEWPMRLYRWIELAAAAVLREADQRATYMRFRRQVESRQHKIHTQPAVTTSVHVAPLKRSFQKRLLRVSMLKKPRSYRRASDYVLLTSLSLSSDERSLNTTGADERKLCGIWRQNLVADRGHQLQHYHLRQGRCTGCSTMPSVRTHFAEFDVVVFKAWCIQRFSIIGTMFLSLAKFHTARADTVGRKTQ